MYKQLFTYVFTGLIIIIGFMMTTVNRVHSETLTDPRLGRPSDAEPSFTVSATYGTRVSIQVKLWDKDGNPLPDKVVSWSSFPVHDTYINFYDSAGDELGQDGNANVPKAVRADSNAVATVSFESRLHQSVRITARTDDKILHNDGTSKHEYATITVETSGITYFDSDSTTRNINSGIAASSNVGDPVTAKHRLSRTLTYSITDGNSDGKFSIDSTTGQIKTTEKITFNKDDASANTYTLTVQAAHSTLSSDTIEVTVNVIQPLLAFDETTPTRSIQENQSAGTNVGNPLTATHRDGETLTYSIVANQGAANSFNIDTSTGQITTQVMLDYEMASSLTIRVSVNDASGNSISIDVTISVTDVDDGSNNSPEFSEGSSTSRDITGPFSSNQGLYNVGSPITATDADGDTLTYRVNSGGGGNFRIGSSSGQLMFETFGNWLANNIGHSWNDIVVGVQDTNGGGDTITVTVTVVATNSAPAFPSNTSTLQITENNQVGANVGSPITATDANTGDVITYTLGGTNSSSFSVDSSTGQIQAQEVFDYETKNAYAVTLTATDQRGGSGNVNVTINIANDTSDDNRAPAFTDGTSTTRSIAENTPANRNIGSAIAATDSDTGDTLTYTLSGANASSFSIVATSGQLRTSAALDYETKNSYRVTVRVSDGNGGSDSITVTINVTDVDETPQQQPVQPNNPPVFSEGASTTRSVAENTASGTNIGSPISATDSDGDTLTCTLSGNDAVAFSIVATSGQLQTAAALDYETKSSYSVTVNASDGNGGSASIVVTINITDVDETVQPPPTVVNNQPEFVDGTSTSRSIEENSVSGTDIGSPISAIDADSGDTLTYNLSGTDAASFSIVTTSGQLRTVASLDFETQTTYTVTVNVFDGNGGSDSITVTINVTDVDEEVTELDLSPTTPSYPGQIGISELMIPSKFGVRSYPQWIELYNNSLTDSVDLSGWKLSIEARDSDDSHRYGEITLSSLPIPANQTALIVTWSGRSTVTLPENRIYNFFNNHAVDFEQNEHRNMVIGEVGFFLKLEDANGNVIDTVGNIDGDSSTTDEPEWELPKFVIDDSIRVSLLRRYAMKTIVPLDGTDSNNWVPSSEANLSVFSYWGNPSDVGNPGHKGRHPLPVELSHFSAELSDAGVLIKWTTESEVDNAGFNIYRSATKNGHFVKVNRKLIEGAGTTGERNEYTWIDSTVKQGIEYYYRIEDISFAGDRQLLVTKRLKGVHTAKNRALTSWGSIKQGLND